MKRRSVEGIFQHPQSIILIDGGRESVGVGTFSEGLRADYFGRCSSVNASHLGCKAKLTQGMNRFYRRRGAHMPGSLFLTVLFLAVCPIIGWWRWQGVK